MNETSGMRDRDRVTEMNWARPGRCVACGAGRGAIVYGLVGHQNFFALLCEDCSYAVEVRADSRERRDEK